MSSLQALPGALFWTHLPYWLAALALGLVVRGIRLRVEAFVRTLERAR